MLASVVFLCKVSCNPSSVEFHLLTQYPQKPYPPPKFYQNLVSKHMSLCYGRGYVDICRLSCVSVWSFFLINPLTVEFRVFTQYSQYPTPPKFSQNLVSTCTLLEKRTF